MPLPDTKEHLYTIHVFFKIAYRSFERLLNLTTIEAKQSTPTCNQLLPVCWCFRCTSYSRYSVCDWEHAYSANYTTAERERNSSERLRSDAWCTVQTADKETHDKQCTSTKKLGQIYTILRYTPFRGSTEIYTIPRFTPSPNLHHPKFTPSQMYMYAVATLTPSTDWHVQRLPLNSNFNLSPDLHRFHIYTVPHFYTVLRFTSSFRFAPNLWFAPFTGLSLTEFADHPRFTSFQIYTPIVFALPRFAPSPDLHPTFTPKSFCKQFLACQTVSCSMAHCRCGLHNS